MNPREIDEFVGLPRWQGMALSQDGARLVGVTDHLGEGDRYRSVLSELDPSGLEPPRVLLESAGQITAFCFGGRDLYLVDNGELKVLDAAWRERSLGPGTAIRALVPTADGNRVVVVETASLADSFGGAALHWSAPIRQNDCDVVTHLTMSILESRRLRQVVGPDVGLVAEAGFFPDRSGSRVLANRSRSAAGGEYCIDLVLIDTATGQMDVLHREGDVRLLAGSVSPDGSRAVVQAVRLTSGLSERRSLAIIDLQTGAAAPLAEGWDRWPTPQAWFPDGEHVLVRADDAGRTPLFRVSVTTDAVTELTHDSGAYDQALVHPTEKAVFAARATIRVPAEAMLIDVGSGSAPPRSLGLPSQYPRFPGTVSELCIPARDGVEIRSWLMLPPGASAENPVPLAVWVHGGPQASWAGWRWARSPWPLVARGTAVLMPDIAMSTGYGQAFIDRGWGDWGGAPLRDLLDATRAVTARPDIDAGRVAVLGTSYGGYLASWAVANCDDFHAAVAHAPPWDLEQQFLVAEDTALHRRRMDPMIRRGHSPRWQVSNIRVPMLISQGGKDSIVPREQALTQWHDLLSHSVLAADSDGRTPHRFLYLPHEGHRISSVPATRAWYCALLAFLDTHLHDHPEVYPPELLAAADGEPA